ncbi:MAG: hypothetical protein ABUL42_01550 [Terricaulis silvestris]
MRKILPLHIGGVAGAKTSLIVPSAMFIEGGRIHLGPHALEHFHRADDDRREMLQSFKMVLGAYDFEEVLDWKLARSIDPDGDFKRGDLIVIYLAYLLELIEQASPAEIGSVFGPDSTTRLRYSRPGWVPGRQGAAYAAMERLFQTASHVRKALGPDLLAPDGVSVARAVEVLAAAIANSEPFANLDGAIYEAGAVAACHFIDPKCPDCLIVADIGAGTTDFAGFIRNGHDKIDVVEKTSRTILVAGDHFDRALMNLLLRKGAAFKSLRQQDAIWRSLLANVRDLKEELITTGKTRYRLDASKVLRCRLPQYLACEDYITASEVIEESFEKCALEMAKAMRGHKQKRIGVVFAGGGVNLPSTVALAKKMKSHVRGLRIKVLPSVPKWAHDLSSEKEFSALFAQMCVAFGTAISVPNQVQSRTSITELA